MASFGHGDVAVLGAGPVGLVAALQLARTRRVLLVSAHQPALEAGWPATVEAVPAGFVALLLELGIHPAEVGVRRGFRRRSIAWEHATPRVVEAAASVHLERPALERALLTRVLTNRNVRLVPTAARAPGWSADQIVDATGRRALTARTRQAPDRPWSVRLFSLARAQARDVPPEFTLAALRDGYVYRLGSETTLVLGVVGVRPPRTAAALASCLAADEATHLLRGIAPGHLRPAPARLASVQWSEGDTIRIGDAALARDPLSSQGLATGISEALAAAAITDDAALLRARQREQRSLHLQHLRDTIARCRFRDTPAWRAYAAWLAKVDVAAGESDAAAAPTVVALVDGKLQRVPRAIAPTRAG